jgi:small subunit ribosomal protein S29
VGQLRGWFRYTEYCTAGAPGSGKSFLLLQAISYCTSSDWIVLSIPRGHYLRLDDLESLTIYLGIELVNCSTPYNYDPRTQTFLQPTLSATLLRQLKEANHPALETLTLTSPFSLEKAPSGAPEVGSPLVQLIDYGIRETSVTSFVLEAVLAELASQTKYAYHLYAVRD